MNQSSPSSPLMIEQAIQASWSLPLWVCVLYLVAAALLAIAVYRRHYHRLGRASLVALVALRTTVLGIVLWMLFGWMQQQYRTQPPELVLLFDRSGSMATADVAVDGESAERLRTRLQWAVEQVTELSAQQRRRLAERYRVRVYSLAETVEPLGEGIAPPKLQRLVADGGQSRLGEGLIQVVGQQAGRGTAAIVFFSDGINTQGRGLVDAGRVARRAAIPVHAVLTGRALAVPDLAIADVLHDPHVFLGDRVIVEVLVTGNHVAADDVEVSLHHSDGHVVDRQVVRWAPGQTQERVRLVFVPEQPGEISLRVQVAAAPEEFATENNVQETVIRVQDRTIRVLLVAENPSYEYRFLKNLLERVQGTGPDALNVFRPQTILQRADAQYVAQDPVARRLVPSDAASIDQVDVFIFMDCDPTLISRRAQELIRDAVIEDGAGCIFVSSDPKFWGQLQGWPLGELLPVGPVDNLPLAAPYLPYRVVPTPIGLSTMPMQLETSDEDSMTVWQQLPPLYARSSLGPLRPAAQVLATADVDQRPLLVAQFGGAGRIALQATDETYRWATFRGNDLYYQRYWGQMLRWLGRGKLVPSYQVSRLLIEPKVASFHQPVRVELHIGNEVDEEALPQQVTVTIEGPEQRTVGLDRQPGHRRTYATVVEDLVPGTYRLTVTQPLSMDTLTQSLEVTAPPGETAQLVPDAAAMRQLAEQTRGRFYSLEDARRLWQELPTGRPARIGNLPPRPLWNHPLVVSIFVLAITAEWLLRRRYRLP